MPLTRRHLLQISALAPLAGCSLGGSAPRTFALRPLSAEASSGPSFSLSIATPQALKILDSERIAFRSGNFEMQYYAGADWIDRAPEMMQMLMIRSFQNRTRLQVTAAPPAEYLLTSILQDFQAEAGNNIQVTLVASLTRAAHRQTARTNAFYANAFAPDDHIESVVAAFDVAVGRATSDLIAWTLESAEEEKTEG